MVSDLDREVVERFLATPASRFASCSRSRALRATEAIQAVVILLVSLALGVRVAAGIAAGW